MTKNGLFPFIGYGVGLRPPHYSYIFDNKPSVDWFEIISENYMDTDGRPRRMLDKILENYPVIMHGVSLSIGTVDPLNSDYLKKLKALAEHVQPSWISDHLCWTGVAHKNTHDLLPVPYTEEALRHIVGRIKKVQDYLGRRIVLENPSTYLEFTSSSIPEWEFIARMADESDCGLLLDANNVYVSCFNHRWDPKTYIDALPLERVAQIHLAGHDNKGTHIVDTHDNYVVDEVWNLYAYIIHKAERPISTMMEWDEHIPEFPIMWEEVEKARRWASAKRDSIILPTFEALKRNNLGSEDLSYDKELGRLQDAILAGDVEKARPEEWIIPKADFKPDEQLSVYVNGYRYRLFDVVYEDYPALVHYLSKKKFSKLLRQYIEQTPSNNFNVARYTKAFPEFIKNNEDEFAYELAVLETHIVQLNDERETRPLEQTDLQGLTPEIFMDSKFQARQALTLLPFAWPVNEYYNQIMAGESPEKPEKRANYIAVYRHEDQMWRLSLEEQEYILLSSIFAGLPVSEAFEASLSPDDDEEELSGKLSLWFGRWISNGLLAAHQ